MASNDVIAPSWKESESVSHFRMMVPMGYQLTGLDRVPRVVVSVVIGVGVGAEAGTSGISVGVE